MAEQNPGRQPTEPASPHKREEARKEGNFAQSGDLSSALALVAALLALTLLGPRLLDELLAFMQGWLGRLEPHRPLGQVLSTQAPSALWPVAWTLLAIFGITAAAGIAAGVLQAGIHFLPGVVWPKWERIGLAAAISRVFSLNGVLSAAFGLLKVGVIGWVAYKTLYTVVDAAPFLFHAPPAALLPRIREWTAALGWNVALPLLGLAAVDYGAKRWKHERDLMMTRDELREENRQQEGDPQIKQRIRAIQRARANRRMMQAVPKATVVVANPTHVAVALRYDTSRNAAPVVVAKGEHLLAQRIKAVAAENGVPIIEEPPLARALARAVPLNAEIPLEFYRAVAEILALLQKRKKAMGVVHGSYGKNGMYEVQGRLA